MNRFLKLRIAVFSGFALAVILMRSGRLEAEEKKIEGLQISVSPVLPLDVDDPAITIHYCNSRGQEDLSFLLPEGKEVILFRQIKVTIDGKKPEYSAVELERRINPTRSRRVKLSPKESAELSIKLGQIYVMPETWQTIKIKAEEIGPWKAEVTGTLILERSATSAK